MDKSIKHDLNSLFFKVNTALELLHDNINNEEKEMVINVIKNSTDKLYFLCKISMLNFENYQPSFNLVDLKEVFSLEKSLHIKTDKYLFSTIIEGIKELFKEKEYVVNIDKNKIYFKGDLNIENSIEKYIVNFIENVSKKIHLVVEIKKDGVLMEWKNL